MASYGVRSVSDGGCDDDAEAVAAPEAIRLQTATIGAAGLHLAAAKAAATQHTANGGSGINVLAAIVFIGKS